MRNYKKEIDQTGITAELIRDILSDYAPDHDRMKRLYERYKASVEGVPILSRSIFEYDGFDINAMKRIDDKVNNRLNNAFDAEIIDTKIGYFLGEAISYGMDEQTEPGVISPTMQDVNLFNLRNHAEDADAELGKRAAICGVGARLLYVDEEGNERMKNIEPWQVVFIGDNVSEPTYSLWAYQEGDTKVVEFYDDLNVTTFESDTGDYQQTSVQPHLFGYNPLFGLANNDELQGDTEKVLALIDAYDRTLSDASNEIEQYRLAYMVFRGLAPADAEENLKYGKIIELLDDKHSVDYLTKDINDDLIEHHLDRLEKNIIRFAKSVDFTDESFAGNSSGVALKQKLRSLENKCIVAERKFVSTLRYQYKVLFSARSLRSSVSKDDYLKMFFTFKRNNPANILEEAQATQALKGMVSEETRLGELSIVDDVQWEIKKMEEEQQAQMEFYGTALGSVDANEADVETESNSSGSNKSKQTKVCPACGGNGKAKSKVDSRMITCPTCKGDGRVNV